MSFELFTLERYSGLHYFRSKTHFWGAKSGGRDGQIHFIFWVRVYKGVDSLWDAEDNVPMVHSLKKFPGLYINAKDEMRSRW